MLRRAFAINSATALLSVAIQLGTTVVVSRLLTPEQIGQFSVGAALCALAIAFRELGVGLYILKEESLTAEKVNAAATVLILSSWTLGAVLFLASGLASAFYDDPALQDIVRLLSLGFLFVPWLAIASSKLQRRLEYDLLAANTILSAGVGSGVSIVLSLQGFGAIALAWGMLCTNVASVVFLAVKRPGDFAWRPALTGIRTILAFSSKVLAGSGAQQAAASAPDLIIGKTLGMLEVGHFSRAMAVRSLVAQHLTGVVYNTLLPKFADEHRQQAASRDALLQRNRFVTGLLLPLYAGTAALASPLVLTLFGRQWVDIVVVVQILCLTPVLTLPFFLVKVSLTAAGHVGVVARQEIACLVARLAALGIGGFISLQAVAGLMLLETVAYLLVIGLAGRRLLQLPARDVLRNSAPDFLLGVVCAGVAWLTSIGMQHTVPGAGSTSAAMASLLAGTAAGAITWLVVLPALNPLLWQEVKRALQLVRSKVSRGA